jgi:hypothetical protein
MDSMSDGALGFRTGCREHATVPKTRLQTSAMVTSTSTPGSMLHNKTPHHQTFPQLRTGVCIDHCYLQRTSTVNSNIAVLPDGGNLLYNIGR